MRLLRGSFPVSCIFLVACGGQAVVPADGTAGSRPSKWVPVPLSPEPQGPVDDDPNFEPVSIKMPASSGSSSASSSSGSSGPSGAYPPPPPYTAAPPGPPMMNDIDDPALATVCADLAAAKGAFTFTPAVAGISDRAHVSITRDLTEHRASDATYRTTFTLFFRRADIFDDPQHGATRIESVDSLSVHLDSPVSHPNAFTIGQHEEVEVAWGEGDHRFACSRDGNATYWMSAEQPLRKATITLTRRDATGVGGTIDIENGSQTLTFDAPFGEEFPGEDGICCLK